MTRAALQPQTKETGMTVSRYMRTGLALLATASLLAACGGGGGGGGPSDTGGQSDSPPQTGTDSTPTPPATPDEDPERPATPATTTTGGGGGSGGSGGSGTGGQTRTPQTCPDGSIIPANATCPTPPPADGPLTGIPWDDPNDDPDKGDIPYAFKASYTIPEDDTSTQDVNEREVYITEIKRDAEYAELTARTIPDRIHQIRSGSDEIALVDDWLAHYADGATRPGGDEPAGCTDAATCQARSAELLAAIPLIHFTAERDSALPHPLIAARGVSMGIDADASADIRLVRAEIDLLDRYLASAEAGKAALEAEIARLTGVATGKESEAQMKQARADQLDREILTLETRIGELDTEIQPLQDEVDQFIADPAYVPTSNDPMFPTLCDSLSDCRAKKAEKELDKAALERDRDDKTGMVSDLRDEERMARAEADDIRSTRIPGLQDDVGEVQGHIEEIRLLQGPIANTFAADEAAADPGPLARVIRDGLARLALEGGYPRNTDGDSDIDSADIAALQGVRGRFAANRALALGLARPYNGGAEQLDEPAGATRSATFARAEPGGVAPEAALRAIARTGGATVDRHTITTDPDGTDLSGDLRMVAGHLGQHWRMDLDGFSVADSGLSGDERQSALTGAGAETRGTFRGVYGTFYCNGASCNALTGSTFGDGWFFTPSVASADGRYETGIGSESTQPTRYRYTANGDGTFTPLHYVDYGMWLTGDPSSLGIEARLELVGPDALGRGTVAVDVTTPNTPSNNLAATATYSGTARGLSARTTGGETASGHFQADVSLSATFGASPTLGGTVTNFRPEAGQGTAHVNPAWSLTLREAALGSGGVIRAQSNEYRWDHDDDESTLPQACGTSLNCGDPRTGVFADDDATGRWSAHGYVASGDVGDRKRPTGFYGGFAAAFDDDGVDQGTQAYPNGDGNLYDDGAAIGVYSAD